MSTGIIPYSLAPPGMEGLYIIVIFKSELDDSDFTKNCQYTLPLRFFLKFQIGSYDRQLWEQSVESRVLQVCMCM